MRLGRLRIEVRDPSGASVNPAGPSASAGPSGQPGAAFASSTNANPLELLLKSGTAYDVSVRLDNKQLSLPGQSVKEGETITVQRNASDFK